MIENARRYALGFMRANAGMFLVFSVVVMALTPVMAIILAQITELPEERALRMIFDMASLYVILYLVLWLFSIPVTTKEREFSFDASRYAENVIIIGIPLVYLFVVHTTGMPVSTAWQIALPVTGLFLGALIMVELVYLALVRAIKWSESWTN